MYNEKKSVNVKNLSWSNGFSQYVTWKRVRCFLSNVY